ncbi:MAG: hypothetical protein ACJATI_002442 [Halioglobus sp.]|jgi:hypothetical protein
MYHKLKFGIDKAFEMLYEITTGKKGANPIMNGRMLRNKLKNRIAVSSEITKRCGG